MRANPQVHVEWIEGEAVALDSKTSQLHYLNGPAALVLALVTEYGYDQALEELGRSHADAQGMNEDLPALFTDMLERGLLLDE